MLDPDQLYSDAFFATVVVSWAALCCIVVGIGCLIHRSRRS